MKSYSRYCRAPAKVAVVAGVQPVACRKSSRYVVVAARDSGVSSAAVRQTVKKAEGSAFSAAWCAVAQSTISR